LLGQITPQYTQSIAAFVELLQRLSNEENGEVFYGRVSACMFLPDLYKTVTATDQATIREIYAKYVQDEMSMVRRAASQCFIRLASLMDHELVQTDMLALMKSTAIDEHPSVKVTAVENLHQFCTLLKKIDAPASVISEIVPTVKATADDPSWRVRLAISKTFGNFAASVPSADVTNDVYPSAINLIQDPEPEVRTSALEMISSFCTVVGAQHYLMEFIPIVVQLVEDPVSTVRKTLTDTCIDVGAMVGPELVTQYISDVIVRLIGDEDPLVKLRILKKLDVIASYAPALCTRLTDHIKGLFKDSNWRVRKQLGVVLPSVTKHMGLEYFADNFLAEYLTLLKDGVDEVREGCASQLASLVSASSANWVHDKVFPTVRAMATDEFLIRLSMLTALQGLLMLDIPERFQTETLALLINATNDKVPNIRLRAAQVLGVACAYIGPENSRTRIRPVLAELLNDKDKDVKYFAAQSMKVCA
jgi:serine/threonine-protein phosphatase 2A regulatory subunit A